MEKLNCPNCGAPIGRFRRTCEYCGSEFGDEYTKVEKIEMVMPKEITINARIKVDARMLRYKSSQEARDFIAQRMIEKMKPLIAQCVEIRQTEDMYCLDEVYMGRLKVIKKEE